MKERAKITADGIKTKGLICPKCKCRDFKTENTIPHERGEIIRYKRCRNCGHRMPTTETERHTLDASYVNYRRKHKSCPECSKVARSVQTNMVYLDDKGEGKDDNSAWCECGWRGIVDDLKPSANGRSKKKRTKSE